MLGDKSQIIDLRERPQGFAVSDMPMMRDRFKAWWKTDAAKPWRETTPPNSALPSHNDETENVMAKSAVTPNDSLWAAWVIIGLSIIAALLAFLRNRRTR